MGVVSGFIPPMVRAWCMHGPFSAPSRYSSAFEFPASVLVTTTQGTPAMPPGAHPRVPGPDPDHARRPFPTTHSSPANAQRPPTDVYQRVRHSPRPAHGAHASLRLTSAVSTRHGPLLTRHDPFRRVPGCPTCPGPPMHTSALSRVPPHPSMAPVPPPPSPAAHAAPSAACPDTRPPPPLASPLCTPPSASPRRPHRRSRSPTTTTSADPGASVAVPALTPLTTPRRSRPTRPAVASHACPSCPTRPARRVPRFAPHTAPGPPVASHRPRRRVPHFQGAATRLGRESTVAQYAISAVPGFKLASPSSSSANSSRLRTLAPRRWRRHRPDSGRRRQVATRGHTP